MWHYIHQHLFLFSFIAVFIGVWVWLVTNMIKAPIDPEQLKWDSRATEKISHDEGIMHEVHQDELEIKLKKHELTRIP